MKNTSSPFFKKIAPSNVAMIRARKSPSTGSGSEVLFRWREGSLLGWVGGRISSGGELAAASSSSFPNPQSPTRRPA